LDFGYYITWKTAFLNPSLPPFAKGRGNYPPLEKGRCEKIVKWVKK
jgi:hypothetical protein